MLPLDCRIRRLPLSETASQPAIRLLLLQRCQERLVLSTHRPREGGHVESGLVGLVFRDGAVRGGLGGRHGGAEQRHVDALILVYRFLHPRAEALETADALRRRGDGLVPPAAAVSQERNGPLSSPVLLVLRGRRLREGRRVEEGLEGHERFASAKRTRRVWALR